MNAQNLLTRYLRPGKLLFGVCFRLSMLFKLPLVVIRTIFIVLTLFFIPLGIVGYLMLLLILHPKTGRSMSYTLMGALVGIPLSYYFQPDVIGHFEGSGNMISYLSNLASTISQYDEYVGNGLEVLVNIFLAMVVCGLAGGAIGYYSTKRKNQKNNE
ncbi:hypothetical protein FKX85_19660 [Echinicola soli]|uniref:Phage shock protein PspC N-terminal domain-containing protein n=1 Tax=Echinicola soli TaxID=2591634 RepID=A0A514CMT4_9BACT|nr:hypothetical protein [Echinicola soli]QDH81126.1 hypothetical protein FKX85_19660 [Echinicola soli]